MSYLVDSDWLIDFLANKPDAVQLIHDLLPKGVSINSIVYLEVLHGIRGSRSPVAGEVAFERLLQAMSFLDFGRAHAGRAADIRLHLRRQKRQIRERALDILIAATAIEHGLTLVTRNTRDYDDIPGLQLYDSAAT